MPRRVRLASWLAFCLHGLFIITARYRLSYDAYTHMFFGDHYRLNWWSLWDARWYTGFEVNSYPPLVHQLIGLTGHLIGVDAAYALLLWLVVSLYPLAVYAFSRIFTGKTAASYAGLAAAVLPSIYLAAHTFGQLPTLTSTLFALFGLAALNEYLLKGERLSGALAVALTAAVMAGHHATLLFLPWAMGGLLIHQLVNHKTGRLKLTLRFSAYALPALAAGLLVIWPFWAWGRGQVMQVPIDHASRHNFFSDPVAALSFFLPVYGPLVFFIPVVLWKGMRKDMLGLWGAFVGLFLLGLGGTTPLPRILFGAGWEWLTYDRFAFWASLTLLPFWGVAMPVLRKHPPFGLGRFRQTRRRLTPASMFFLGLVALLAGLQPTLLPTQPGQIDMQPIVDFLARGNHAQWRYVTFGMGDQFAYLSRLTPATSIDGSYHTARNLPELRESGIAQIDTAFWYPGGLAALDPILEKSGEWGVRWGFVLFKAYDRVLARNGWVLRTKLSDGVQVWENPAAVLPAPVHPPEENPLAEFSWGVLPLLALFIAGCLAMVRVMPARASKVLAGVQSLAVGLLPAGLCFWYFRILAANNHARVYFTYDNALFFLSDGLALAAVLAWGIRRIFTPDQPGGGPSGWDFRRVEPWLIGLCSLATLSIFWSADPKTSFYFSLHLWLACGLFLSMQDQLELWRAFAIGGLAALFIQATLGIWQFASQSTAFMGPLGLNWPGLLTPAMQGASVVQLEDGTRWLRAYGSLPHPNILGGLVFAFLAGVAALYLLNREHRPWLLIGTSLGAVLLVLTFSRSAWLALAVFWLILLFQWRKFNWMRLTLLLVTSLACLALSTWAVWPLIFTRSSGATVATEAFSSKARAWLMQESMQFILERPLTGMGAGAFIIELSRRASLGYIIEPVHDLPLLLSAELGLGGAVLLAGLVGALLLQAWRARRPLAAIQLAALAGLGVISLFDHYLWTLAPGQILLSAALGLWAGQLRLQEAQLQHQLVKPRQGPALNSPAFQDKTSD